MNIIEVINAQRKGRCLIEAQEQLQELVKACSDTGKKGKLTITLEIIPAETGTVVLRDDITTKLPKPERSSTSFFADEQGSLHRDDPKQPEFEEVQKAVNQ